MLGPSPWRFFHPDDTDANDVVSLIGNGDYAINLTQTVGGSATTVDLAVPQGAAGESVSVFNFVDDAPTAEDDYAENPLLVEGGTAEIVVLADNGSGADRGSTDGVKLDGVNVSIAVDGQPDKGTVTYDGNGTFTYTADVGASGSDDFTYTLTDGDGDQSTATVFVTIDPFITFPTLSVDETDGQQANPEDTVSDRISAAQLSGFFAAVTGAATYTVSVSADGVGSGLFAVDTQLGVKGNEILLYNNDGVIEGRVSITDLSGGSVEAVIFTISNDGAGSLVLEQVINAGPIPLAIFHPDDTDANDVVSLIGNGDYAINLTQTVGGSATTVDLAVPQGAAGESVSVFNFVDDAPTAEDDYAENPLLVEGGTAEIVVLADNGSGADIGSTDGVKLDGVNVSIAVDGQPDKGTVTYDGNGTFTYTADVGASGSDDFTYTLTDGDGDQSTATVFVTIDPFITFPDAQC